MIKMAGEDGKVTEEPVSDFHSAEQRLLRLYVADVQLSKMYIPFF